MENRTTSLGDSYYTAGITAVCIYSEWNENLDRMIKSIPQGWDLVLCKTTKDLPQKDKVTVIDNKKVLLREFHYQEFSFAEARNYAMKYLTTEWILAIDSDEELIYNPKEWEFGNVEKIGAISVNMICPQGNGVTQYFRNFRIFRNGFQFRYSCHERIDLDVLEQGYKLGTSLIHIKHNGYNIEPVGILDKLKRNYDLILRDLNTLYRDDLYLMNYLRRILDDMAKFKMFEDI